MSDDHFPRDFERLELPLAAAVQAALAEPLPDDAVQRVKARACKLAAAHVAPHRVADARRRGWKIPRSLAASLSVAAALLAIATALVLLVDHSGGRAFAQMIERVKAAGSVHFSMTTQFGRGPKIGGRMYLKGDRMRFEHDAGAVVQIMDLQGKQSLILNTAENQFQQFEISRPTIAGWDADPIEQLRRVKRDDAKSMGQEILRGRRTQVYRLQEVNLLGIRGRVDTMLWVDLESDLPAKILILDADPKHSAEFVFDNFVWNEPLDAQLFSMDVPAGFKPGTILIATKLRKADAATPDAAPAFADGILRDRTPAHILWNPKGTTITALMRDPESVPSVERRLNELRQWDVATGKLRWSEDIAGASNVAATADGAILATVVGYEVQLRDAASGKIVRTWAANEPLFPLAFSPDGKTLAAGIAQWGPHGGRGSEPSGGFQLWNVEQGSLVRAVSDDKPVTFITYSVDGKFVATSSNEGPIKLWDAATGELVRLFPGRLWASFSPDGQAIACLSKASPGDKSVGRVDLYNLDDASLIRTFVSEKGPSASWLLRVAFSPDGRLVAATDWNSMVTLWDVATGQRKHALTDHHAGVLSAAFSPDGETLATGGEDQTLRLGKIPDATSEHAQ